MSNMDNQDLQNQIDELRVGLNSLREEFYRNNFKSTQDFTKSSTFTNRLKIPHYDQLPTKGEVGEIIEVGGKLYICETPTTFTICST